MTTLILQAPESLKGSHVVQLPASKSISNRALIVAAQCQVIGRIDNLSDADDTKLLLKALTEPTDDINVGHGGTTLRFLLAYLAVNGYKCLLSGSNQLNKRPVKPLVEALRRLGADIEYVDVDGYPPLRLKGFVQKENKVHIPAHVSSQFISALLLVAPSLPQGLDINLMGRVISRPYLDMTLKVMNHYGIYPEWEGTKIRVNAGSYEPKSFSVESDWSAASYIYALATAYREASFTMPGLYDVSIQGDAKIRTYSREFFGVSTQINDDGATCQWSGNEPSAFEGDLLQEPDLCPAIAVMCAINNVSGRFNGLESLRIKETDRIAALHQELSHWGYSFEEVEDGAFRYILSGRLKKTSYMPVIKTYHDHRMAMALSVMSSLQPITIAGPLVVTKSFPGFWQMLEALGFSLDWQE